MLLIILLGCVVMFTAGYGIGVRRALDTPRELLVNAEEVYDTYKINPYLEHGWTIKSVYRYSIGATRFAQYHLVSSPGQDRNSIWSDMMFGPGGLKLPIPTSTPAPTP